MRYAIYYTPPADDPLTRQAAQWLGRDAFSGGDVVQPALTSFSQAALDMLTADARRYGFHATLKAPFELAEDMSEAALISALDDIAASTPSFTLPQLVIGQIGRFFALVPADWHPQLQLLADTCVSRLDAFRAPLSNADLARRKPETLTERQRRHLAEWGYPYVFDDFQFHMTLTAQVDHADQPAMREALENHFEGVVPSPRDIGHLALFVEPARGSHFKLKHIFQLADAAGRKTA